MPHWHFIAVIGLVLGIAIGAGAPSDAALSVMTLAMGNTDSISLPPERIERYSPNRQFALVIESLDGWRSPVATAKFFRAGPPGEILLWQARLPQEYGPRFAIVGNQGQVLLLDEWINVESKNAIWLRTLHTMVTYDFNAVAALLNLPRRDIVKSAAFGWWISGVPLLAETGAVAIVPSAGHRIRIDLDNGQLSLLK
jgi:hypothetical protein